MDRQCFVCIIIILSGISKSFNQVGVENQIKPTLSASIDCLLHVYCMISLKLSVVVLP